MENNYNYWEHYKIQGDEIVFTIPKPNEFNERALKHGIKINTSEYNFWKIANEHFIGLNSISKTQRQDILSVWRNGGITIGECATRFGVTSDIVADIIVFNLKNYSYLETESI